MVQLKIVGVQETIYMAHRVRDNDRGYGYRGYRALSKSHIIYGNVLEGCSDFQRGDILAIKLSIIEHECYSGYCISQTAKVRIRKVRNNGPPTHVPKQELIVSLPWPLERDRENDYQNVSINNELFWYSEDGGDSYYPMGSYYINFDLLEKTRRFKERRIVYIFTGASGVGKSFLADKLMEVEVYETDAKETLPDAIYANLIVLGKRSGFTLEQVKSKIPDNCEVVVCDFNEPLTINDGKEFEVFQPQSGFARPEEDWEESSFLNDDESS